MRRPLVSEGSRDGTPGIWWGMPGIWWSVEAGPPGNPESGGTYPESGGMEPGIWWKLTRNLVECSPESGGKRAIKTQQEQRDRAS